MSGLRQPSLPAPALPKCVPGYGVQGKVKKRQALELLQPSPLAPARSKSVLRHGVQDSGIALCEG